jgi:hypothetical protein
MITEKIQSIVTQLMDECRKEDVNLSIGILDDSHESILAQLGSNTEIESSIAMQTEQWIKNLDNCGCLACRMKLSAINPDLSTEEVEENSSNIMEIIDKAIEKHKQNMRGDY